MRMIVAMSLVLLAAPALSGEQESGTHALRDDGVAAAINRALEDCRSWDDGEFAVGDGALTSVDLTGDGVPETVLDESRFSCSTAASLWCGTGGCMVRVFGAGEPYARLAKGWRPVEWAGDTILLLQIHGSECGGTNLRRCYEAVSYSEGAFRSVRTPPSD